MSSNRRSWLKQIGLGVAGLTISRLETIASPSHSFTREFIVDKPIRLSSNENPYGPSPLARKAMADHLLESNRYGGARTNELVLAIAQKYNLTGDNVLMGAGSTEILDIVARYSALQGGSFVIPVPTFAFWADMIEKTGFKKITVPLTADKKIDLPAMMAAIQDDTKLVYICNPNNPTGTMLERDKLVEFVKKISEKSLVLVDEAYIDFTEQPSLCSLVAEHRNIIIAKTFSKIYGMAGARVGYALAHKDTINDISQVTTWVNGSCSVPSVAAAIASLKDEKFVKETYANIHEVRKYTIGEMEKLNIRCIPSNTNFIYFTLADYKKDYFDLLKRNSIWGTGIYEEEGKWSRITVGTKEEMQQFIRILS
ncbi:MAG: histidinol-phosphate transaminase [Agriterribacter sp.]